MKQPIKEKQTKTKATYYKKNIKEKADNSKISKKSLIKRKHKEYGTSKLEERFAKDFLDKLGIKYTYQFKVEAIGRYYDFLLETKLGSKILIEVDGDFYHSYGLTHEEKNPMQKHNEYVDRVKDEWAFSHGIPLIRIWEHDINKSPNKVIKILKEAIGINDKKTIIKENKKKRH